MSDQYRFNIQNNHVVGILEWDDGRWEQEKIDADERYYVENNTVYKEERDDGGLEVTAFTDDDNDGIFVEGQTTYSHSTTGQDYYTFDVQDNVVIGKTEYEADGDVERESIFNHSFEINDNLITEFEPQRSGFEKTVYQDINNDGQYHKLSEEFVRDHHDSDRQSTDPFEPLNTEDQEETVLILNPHQQDSVSFNVGDDLKIFNFNASEGDQINLSQEFGISSAEEFMQHIEDIEHDGHTLEVDLGELGEIEIVGITSEDITWDIVNFGG
ncbi:hypothetical protein [Marinomonas gallaica]|uniref:hypothetical protein n=1 Tax=Marinomonas gallaica TaxID=1806667 RepID=UPI0008326C9A|nr:hypothetical protein [Marinomonas gallaica]